jgi:hypothetical protein
VENNDIIDVCKPNLDEAISLEATIYLYGSHNFPVLCSNVQLRADFIIG